MPCRSQGRPGWRDGFVCLPADRTETHWQLHTNIVFTSGYRVQTDHMRIGVELTADRHMSSICGSYVSDSFRGAHVPKRLQLKGCQRKPRGT